MHDEQIERLLGEIGQGDRDALRQLFDLIGPAVSQRLAFRGVAPDAAGKALAGLFAQLWSGDYGAPLRPGQSLSDWLGDAAEAHVTIKPGQPQAQAIQINDALWAKVRSEAFPESPRNLLRNSGLLFAVAGAVLWGLILFVIQRLG